MITKDNLFDLLKLMRPYWWGKTIFLVTFGAVMAVGGVPPLSMLILMALIVGLILYGGLYILNDLSDIKLDQLDPEKKNRPLSNGIISPKRGLILAVVLITIASVTSFLINQLVFICVIVMLINQLMYSFKPFRLKDKFFFDVFSTSIISTSFKFLAGWFLFTDSLNVPLLPLLGINFIQIGAYLAYKSKGNKQLKLNQGTIAVLDDKKIETISVIAFVLGFLSLILLTLNSVFLKQTELWGVLPLRFLWVILACIILVPIYWKRFKQSEGATKIQRSMYDYYLLFTILLLVLYSF